MQARIYALAWGLLPYTTSTPLAVLLLVNLFGGAKQ